MVRVECPKPAYDRLVKSGLDNKIFASEGKITDIISGPYLESGIFYDLIKEAEEHMTRQDLKINEKTSLYKDILGVNSHADEYGFVSGDKEELLIKFPGLLAFAALGDDLFRYAEYGFSNIRQLMESVASFCLGKEIRARQEGGYYYWRHGKYKNKLSNEWHGDCHFFQTDASGEDYKVNTLFGQEEVFDTWKDVMGCSKGVNAGYDYWQTLLTITLLYAKAIGKQKMPEIVNWRDVLKEVGSAGTCTAEAEFGSGVGGLEIDDRYILIEGEEMKNILLFIGEVDNYYYPYVSDNKLFYIKEDPQGQIELPFERGFIAGKRFSPYIVYEGDELPEILKGTYRLFARDRRLLPKIMDAFLSKV